MGQIDQRPQIGKSEIYTQVWVIITSLRLVKQVIKTLIIGQLKECTITSWIILSKQICYCSLIT